ncbi:MAG: histidine kinase [Candidatus Pedobacter colombiensis]|uniref:Histidine kinase n=1 Tax=Candidatus Pedobacter colombiensis TaxID=3121371 RepID=A0AAJ5W3T0_9SPHI|nr:histidine kinase [Pedobacter sp.]WEK17993.1 MAG: histidine kinase [Pedobacter sp.]
MKDNCSTETDSRRIEVFRNPGFFQRNLTYLLIGFGIGCVLSALISVFSGHFIGFRSVSYEILFSVIISLAIGNSVYLSQKLLKFNRDQIWLFIILYYASSLAAMLLAIESIYFIKWLLFNEPYQLFHPHDYLVSSMLVVIICTIFYIYNSQKARLHARIRERDLDVLKLRQMKTQAELATLQSKINPHFLYNALNAIASLIHEQPDQAEDMTLKLSKLFRYSINNNQDDLVTVAEEMEIVSTYLDIEQIRFGDRISFILDIDPALKQERIPRFLIQPLIENALKHGLKDIAAGAELRITIRKDSRLVIAISDNGAPFPDELNIGYGLQSTFDKLNLLYGSAYELQLLNKPIKQIEIKIPMQHG